MTAKAAIIERLGENAVLLPSLIADALAANDRLKLRLSLLQDAVHQAKSPARARRDFLSERRAAGLADPVFDSLSTGARLAGPGRAFVPGVAVLVSGIPDDLSAMLAPLNAAELQSAAAFRSRADAVVGALPSADGDLIDFAAVDGIASAQRGTRDSLHLLVMDLHKAINCLAAETAPETLDGAQVHALDARGRAAVVAFMRGLHRTSPLAFGHPGLDTTAVQAGGRLTIQNDIGTTDAHVLVIHVEAGRVTVTYTDVHRSRAKFFVSLFDGRGVTWSSLEEQHARGFEDDAFYLLTGEICSGDCAALDGFLDFLGSRIVFLIDWNKARKALQTFLGKNAAIELLTWSARNDFGHRAFLELGGTDLIFDAVHRVAAGRIPYGVRLDEALGTDTCMEFLQRALRNTSQGLSAGRTTRLIRDEIQADLARRFETAESLVLTVLVRHLGLSRMLAGAIADSVSPPGATAAARRILAARAKQLEAKADRLTVSAREIAARVRGADMLRSVIDEVENTADALEDCAYLLSLLPEGESLELAPLGRLSEIATDSVGHLVRAVEAASHLPKGRRADATNALKSIDAVVIAEREADAAERDAFAAIMGTPRSDARALVLGLEIARGVETATDHLLHSALSLRDRVLEELSA